jgi:hypothetical protein
LAYGNSNTGRIELKFTNGDSTSYRVNLDEYIKQYNLFLGRINTQSTSSTQRISPKISESSFKIALDPNVKGGVVITGFTGTEQDISIPTRIQNYPVTGISEFAFSGCTSLTNVTIPSSVTSIGGSAFAFCESLTSVTIPDSATSIGGDAFLGCTSLTSVTIPNSVTSIGEFAFARCTSLTSINVTASNSTFSMQDGVLYNKNKTYLHTYPAGKKGAFVIPNNVTSIGNGAFYICTSLTSVTIPSSVTSIGGSAFAFCENLTNVTIPISVTSIGVRAFSGCTSLTSVIIPNSVTNIGIWAFSHCTSLTSVTFATGSNISSTNFGSQVFPEGSEGIGGDRLKNAYNYGKAGTYKRTVNVDTWTKE